MLFNSNFFLTIFLPLLFIIYFLVQKFLKNPINVQNAIILLFSLFFYLCTGGASIFILLIVILMNYLCARFMENFNKMRKFWFIIGVLGNIGVLLYYKYFIFLYDNYISIAKRITGDAPDALFNIVLPVGISFYIFQALSYVIDVYKEEVPVQRNFLKFTLYISLFPQLVAGPIVRYSTVCAEINQRHTDVDDIYEGACRFVFGLGKKVLIADFLGEGVDTIWALPTDNLTTALAWSAAFLYTFQIYFDFSGYSDMAIGIGRILGFHFLENFQLPYTSQNVTEFWRKWHISLSSFLRDYLYIPLGGNRKGTMRTYLNLLIVFVVCGLWHGAAWNFALWGLYHGVFLVIERVINHKMQFKMKGLLGRCITFFIVMIGWVIFRADSISSAFTFLRVMFGQQMLVGYQYYEYGYFIFPKIIVIAIFAFAVSFFTFDRLRNSFKESKIKGIIAIGILVISMAYMSDASFTPFIYFQF